MNMAHLVVAGTLYRMLSRLRRAGIDNEYKVISSVILMGYCLGRAQLVKNNVVFVRMFAWEQKLPQTRSFDLSSQVPKQPGLSKHPTAHS
jgi:hypothetical protein